MKVTEQDVELAKRFPLESTSWGFGTTMMEAKLSLAQLQRLLKLKLIEPDERSRQYGGFAGADGAKNPGAGHMGRSCTGFIRTNKET